MSEIGDFFMDKNIHETGAILQLGRKSKISAIWNILCTKMWLSQKVKRTYFMRIVWIMGLSFKEGYSNQITCGYVVCDASFEYCDTVTQDCVSCMSFCIYDYEYCQVLCPVFYNDRIATTTSTPLNSTPIQNFTSPFNATDIRLPPPSRNLGVIFIVIIILFFILALSFVVGSIRIHCIARHRRYQRTSDVHSIKTDAKPRPNRSVGTGRAEVSKKSLCMSLFFSDDLNNIVEGKRSSIVKV